MQDVSALTTEIVHDDLLERESSKIRTDDEVLVLVAFHVSLLA